MKQLGGAEAVQALTSGLYSSSVLLGHECAYVLGQLQDPLAAAALSLCLQDSGAHAIVRHECAEALANIGLDESLPLLERMAQDDCSEVAETAAIAVEKLRQLRRAAGREEGEEGGEGEEWEDDGAAAATASKFASVDPAPPLPCSSVDALLLRLCDGSLSLYERYRAMFSLRNLGSAEAVAALSEALSSSSSPVFRHELCYVMGQMQHPAALPCLQRLLADRSEHAMVRHEAAEAIGSIAADECEAVLRPFAQPAAEDDLIVRQSCDVALDLAEYWNSDETCTALQEPDDDDDEAQTADCSDRRRLTAAIAVTRPA